MSEGVLKGRYAKLQQNRTSYLRRARAAAEVTLPYTFPPEGSDGDTPLPTPYQSVGARGVTNLAAKLLLALLPPNDPFFKYQIDDITLDEMDEDTKGEAEAALAKYERVIKDDIEASTIRVSTNDAIIDLLVGGNALAFIPQVPDDERTQMRVFNLENYVVKRTPEGEVKQIIILENAMPSTLDESVRSACQCSEVEDDTKTVEIYTGITLKGDKWEVYQEINGNRVPGSEGSYNKDASPYFPLTFNRAENEDYGRGLVEQYLGDLISLESLSKSIVIGAAAAAKVLFFVAPNSSTKATTCTKAKSGDFVTGKAEDISTLQLEKFNDFRVASEMMDKIEGRLNQAFLLRGSVTRDAERVTAEEIRFMAVELDDALGGIYSVLAQDFQIPLVTRLVVNLEKKEKLPILPDELVKPIIVTGLDALGRNADLLKLDQWVTGIFNLSPELANTYVKLNEYLRQRAAALSLNVDDLLKSEEEVAQATQQAQIQDIVRTLGPEAMKQFSAMAQSGGAQPQPQT
jgi:hypothetical protein